MRSALISGAPVAPAWIDVLEASESWGIPPWEIAPEIPKIVWWYRNLALKKERIRAEEYKARGRKA